MSSHGHRVFMSVVFVALSAALLLGSTSVAQAQESVTCGTGTRTWTPQETWVWQQLCLGKSADLESSGRFGDPSDSDVNKTWSGSRVIRSQFLETILVEQKYLRHISNHPVHISGAWFPEKLDLAERDFPSSLYFFDSRFDESLDLSNSHVGGNIAFSGSAIYGELDLNGTEVAGSVFLRGKGSFQDVALIGASIGGNVEADGSTFHKKLDLSGARVAESVFLRREGSFQEVDLIGADVGGNVEATESTFHKELNLSTATVAGSVYIYDSSFHDVRLLAANIGGGAYLSGSSFDGYVNFSNAKITGILQLAFDNESTHWTDSSTLDLRATSVFGIDDDKNAWPKHLHLTGFTFEIPSGYRAQAGKSLGDREVSWYAEWLECDEGYSRQPYRQVETILRSMGRDRQADAIAMMSKDRQYDQRNEVVQVAGELHKWTVGYGYSPERIIPWALAFVFLGGIIANWLPKTVTGKVSSRFILSAQHLIPLINFGKTYADADVTGREIRPWVRGYFYFHSFVGYVLAGLLVAALTRLTANAGG